MIDHMGVNVRNFETSKAFYGGHNVEAVCHDPV